MNFRRAFTLIELLVVIAIIAILAAILFPVFAQAKAAAKATSCLSDLKQLNLGVLQYMNDYDDDGPQGLPYFQGTWHQGFYGWQFPCNPGEFDCNEWGNSTMPYIKSNGIFSCPAAAATFNIYGYNSSVPSTSYTLNGNIQFSSQTSVVSPAATVLIWEGFQNTKWQGRTWAQPLLNCPDTTSTCVYTPNPDGTGTANGQSDSFVEYGVGNNSAWIHTQGENFTFIDGHAKYRIETGSPTTDPFTQHDPTGSIFVNGGYSWWESGGHTCLFGLDDPCGL